MPAALTTILRLLVGILTLQTCQCQKCIDRYDRICGAFAIFGHLEERKAVLSYNCLDPQDFPNYHFCHFGGIWSANVWTCLNHHQLDNLITKPTVQHTLQDDVFKKQVPISNQSQSRWLQTPVHLAVIATFLLTSWSQIWKAPTYQNTGIILCIRMYKMYQYVYIYI